MVNNAEYNSPKQVYIEPAKLLTLPNTTRVYYENAPAYSDNEYQQKLHGITDLLAKAHADIIAIQEVWDSQALEALAVGLGFKPEHVVIPLASNDKASPY